MAKPPLPKIVIWGACGHALVVLDILRLQGQYEIVGLLDDLNPEHWGQSVNGVRVLGGREQLNELRSQGVTHVIFGFGDCSARAHLIPLLEARGFEFATAIHPRATIAEGVLVASGTVIAAGAVVNPGVEIGRNCIINTCASVDHECVIGKAVHLSPGVRLAGRVSVGDAAWIGIGATVLDQIRVGARSLVGAGALITKDVPEDAVVYGVPGKFVRSVGVQRRRSNLPG